MPIDENLDTLEGRAVVDWSPDEGFDGATQLPRISLSYDEHDKKITWGDKFAQFLQSPDAGQTTGLVVGMWDYDYSESDSSPIVRLIVNARDQLSHIQTLFFGDITVEENEMSWIKQADISPLLTSFPNLTYFASRGMDGLKLQEISHDKLRTFVLQTGGMSSEIATTAIQCDFPNLEHFELWLGEENYGATVSLTDLQPLFNDEKFPKLKVLALRNSEIVDLIAPTISNAPILNRLETLDLSLGTLTDEGAQFLLDSQLIPHLKKLDLHRHFCSETTTEKLQALPIEVDVSQREEAEEYDGEIYRYVAVGE